MTSLVLYRFFFFFNDTATTEIYTLSLHDALPISTRAPFERNRCHGAPQTSTCRDRKSTRLNSSHGYISYAVFCLKKKKKQTLELCILKKTKKNTKTNTTQQSK